MPHRRMAAALLALLALLVLPPRAAPQDARLPIFDVHLHYSEGAWAAYPPDAVREKLLAAGVPRALVSSTPDDGSLTLRDLDAERFVPVLRPYRAAVGSGNWTGDAATPAYLRERLARGGYAGIGEFHLHDVASARSDVVRAAARLAVAHGLMLHVHADAPPVQAIFEAEPAVRILWAHAGMVTPVQEVRAMLARHDRLWAELSFREHQIVGPDGGLHPAWGKLLGDFPDRFLAASDTWTPSRFDDYGGLIDAHRRYLALLPARLARAIAYGNAVRLFGGGEAFPAP